MSKRDSNVTRFLMGALAFAGGAFAQELPCEIGPRTIRAYSLAETDSICLVWPGNQYRQDLQVARREYSDEPTEWPDWVEIYAVTDPEVAREAGEYCDTDVRSGIHYEYRISDTISSYDCSWRTTVGFKNYQYISTGTEVPLRDQRGKVILLVEKSIGTALSAEIARLEEDLRGDGYQVFRTDVAASEVTAEDWKARVAETKAVIRDAYETDPDEDWTIFIVGHVPIPYSGLMSPGSHEDNFGAQPADWYYADMDENVWTDTTASDTSANYPWNWNVPGDGKFDQIYMPSTPELRIGRLDLFNMPAFGKSEVELMRQYLDRNHAWRHKQFTARDRGLIISSGHPFDSHNTYASFFGSATNVDLGLWLSAATTPESSYLFAASRGSGGFTRDLQLGWTEDFAATSLYIVFPTMYGSYYGNWDSAMHPDVVLLAPLASEGYVLSTYYHENTVNVDSSAMGESIGYELYALASNLPVRGRFKRYDAYGRIVDGKLYGRAEYPKTYVTLMGDPTLRLRVVAPPRSVRVSVDGEANVISWSSATDTNIQGYHVYRAPATDHNAFTRLTRTPVDGVAFRDPNAAGGDFSYLVRTVKLEQSSNRSYYNASQGILASAGSKLTAVSNAENGRSLLVTGSVGSEYTVEYATNLSNATAWYPLTEITLTEETESVSVGKTNEVIFYRLRR